MDQPAEGAQRVLPRPDAIPLNPIRALVSPYTALASIHLISDVLVGTVTFTVVLTLVALSGSMLALALVGVPLWVLTVHVVRRLSAFERGRFRLTLGMDLPAPKLPSRGRFLRYAWSLAKSPTVWRQIGYHLLLLPWGVVAMVLTMVAWTVPLSLATLPLYFPLLGAHSADLWLFSVGDVRTEAAVAVLGVVLLVFVTPNVVRVLRTVDAELARTLLSSLGSEELAERVDELTVSRRRSVDSAQAERLRIERDLHDGAQQRLVSLAMTLGRAKSRLGADDAARELIDEAHQEAKMAITELRDLTRGLQPPVLSDRGLDAALSALAARSPVPVKVAVDIGDRPSPTVEAIAYFVVAEALTNVAKHSGAHRASVIVHRTDDALHVVVTDDGMGSASEQGGSGLAGISDRIAGVDGKLTLLSPVGGPTVLTVVLPCG
ncbi:MAG: sensor domain-containing protein [Actinomycetota bacterium]